MSLTVASIPREFHLDDMILPDPNPEMSTDDVMNFYAATYPELTNSTIEGPRIENDKQIFTMSKTVGTKG